MIVGAISMIRKEWWHRNPDALGEAEGVADRLDFHAERRNVGETIPARPVQGSR